MHGAKKMLWQMALEILSIGIICALLVGLRHLFPVAAGSDYKATFVAQVEAQSQSEVVAYRGPVDINLATAKQLMTLNGIGAALAGRIVDYRLSNGYFQTVDDILQVKGIGTAKLAVIRDYICVNSVDLTIYLAK